MSEDKQKKLTNMVSSFCRQNLSDEHNDFAVNLVDKMARKHKVPFMRGKIEIWASGIIYAIAQRYSLFERSSPYHISADDICSHFNTSKSTVSKKAAVISDMFNLKQINQLSTESSNEGNLFDEVNMLFKNKEYEKALDKIEGIDENDPNYSAALFYKSVILSYIDDKPNDLKDDDYFDNILFENENPPDTSDKELDEFFISGLDEFNSGNFEDALDLFDLSISFNPDESEIYYYKALTLGFLDKYEEAIDTIDKALMIDYDDYRFWNDKANFLTKAGDFVKAEKCYNHAIKLKPEDALILANKGMMYIQNERYEDALNVLINAYKLDSGNISIIINMANIYMDMRNYAAAKMLLDEAAMIDNKNIDYLIARGHYLTSQKKYQESIIFWDLALEFNPNLAEVWVNKAIANSYLGHEEEYERCMEKASEIDPLIMFSLEEDDAI